jgi:hypothetical protein
MIRENIKRVDNALYYLNDDDKIVKVPTFRISGDLAVPIWEDEKIVDPCDPTLSKKERDRLYEIGDELIESEEAEMERI